MLKRRAERPFWKEVNEGFLMAFFLVFSWRQQSQQVFSAPFFQPALEVPIPSGLGFADPGTPRSVRTCDPLPAELSLQVSHSLASTLPSRCRSAMSPRDT